MQAIILAAGMGKRLGDLTKNSTKGMVNFLDQPIIFRLVDQIISNNINKIIVVVGFGKDELIEELTKRFKKVNFEFVENKIYSTTNNIYSLFLAKDFLEQDDSLLFESDLVFDDSLLKRVCDKKEKNVVVVSPYQSWMDGTVVTLRDDRIIDNFVSGKQLKLSEKNKYFKTVNIYKFSSKFSKNHYNPFIEAYIKSMGSDEYYEDVLKVISFLNKIKMKALITKPEERWYEIDDKHDLYNAEGIFSKSEDKLNNISKRFGGYWRFPKLIDFCYLVNPYYPTVGFKEQIKYSFDDLLINYPSGQKVNSLLASKNFNVSEDFIVVGNGAAELIKAYAELFSGKKVGIMLPTFEDYTERFKNSKINTYTFNDSFSYGYNEIESIIDDIDLLLIVNPDNPSGNFIERADLIKILSLAKLKNKEVLVDESFIDFAENKKRFSFLDNQILKEYKNLKVIKSISKSYGVPGIRLGVFASYDISTVHDVREKMSLWNINSYGEFFLQNMDKYNSDYKIAKDKIVNSRNKMMKKLKSLNFIKPLPSEANYILCEVEKPLDSSSLTVELLNDYNILIKDCKHKLGFSNRSFVRLAVRNDGDNNSLINALKFIEAKLI